MTHIRYASSLLLLAGPTLAQSPPSEWTPCKAPVEVASRAYKRILDAKSHPTLQHDRKSAFWDVYEFAHSCPEIKQIAAELVKNGLSADSSPPKGSASSGYFGAAEFGLPADCTQNGKMVCSFIVTKPSKGNAQGADKGLEWYFLDSSSKGGASGTEGFKYEWKELDAKTLKLPKSMYFQK